MAWGSAIRHKKTKHEGGHWANVRHAEQQRATRTGASAPPTAPMNTKNVYAWDTLQAARNDVETVANIRAYLERQRKINLAVNAA